MKVAAGYYCSVADFEMVNAGFGVIYGLDGWGSCMGGEGAKEK